MSYSRKNILKTLLQNKPFQLDPIKNTSDFQKQTKLIAEFSSVLSPLGFTLLNYKNYLYLAGNFNNLSKETYINYLITGQALAQSSELPAIDFASFKDLIMTIANKYDTVLDIENESQYLKQILKDILPNFFGKTLGLFTLEKNPDTIDTSNLLIQFKPDVKDKLHIWLQSIQTITSAPQIHAEKMLHQLLQDKVLIKENDPSYFTSHHLNDFVDYWNEHELLLNQFNIEITSSYILLMDPNLLDQDRSLIMTKALHVLTTYAQNSNAPVTISALTEHCATTLSLTLPKSEIKQIIQFGLINHYLDNQLKPTTLLYRYALSKEI